MPHSRSAPSPTNSIFVVSFTPSNKTPRFCCSLTFFGQAGLCSRTMFSFSLFQSSTPLLNLLNPMWLYVNPESYQCKSTTGLHPHLPLVAASLCPFHQPIPMFSIASLHVPIVVLWRPIFSPAFHSSPTQYLSSCQPNHFFATSNQLPQRASSNMHQRVRSPVASRSVPLLDPKFQCLIRLGQGPPPFLIQTLNSS